MMKNNKFHLSHACKIISWGKRKKCYGHLLRSLLESKRDLEDFMDIITKA